MRLHLHLLWPWPRAHLPVAHSALLPRSPSAPALPLHLTCSFLPRNVQIIGYARSQLTTEQLRAKLAPRLEGSQEEKDAFLQRCTYIQGEPFACFHFLSLGSKFIILS